LDHNSHFLKPVRKPFFIVLFSIIYALSSAKPGSVEEDLFKIPRISKPIVFDGICIDPAYDLIEPLPVRMFSPGHGNDPTEQSEIFITYDDEFIYMSARLHFTNGARILGTSKKRDPSPGGNDLLGVMFDSFNDNENGLGFETNPAGLRADFSISNDGQVNDLRQLWNRNWNTFWDVKTMVYNNVWHVEMKIPFSSLRFQDDNGRVIMGMTVWRSIVDKQENNVFPLRTNDFGITSIWKPSLCQKVVHAAKDLKIGLILGTCYKESVNGTEYCYNEARIYTPDGTFLGVYSKILTCSPLQFPGSGEMSEYVQGSVNTFLYKNIRFGVLICNDLWATPGYTTTPNPYLAWKMHQAGAQFLFHIINSGSDLAYKPFHESSVSLWARALQIPIVEVNASKKEKRLNARSGVVGEDGERKNDVPDIGEQLFIYDLVIK